MAPNPKFVLPIKKRKINFIDFIQEEEPLPKRLRLLDEVKVEDKKYHETPLIPRLQRKTMKMVRKNLFGAPKVSLRLYNFIFVLI